MTDTDQRELETLRRMLATPPSPHKKLDKKDRRDSNEPRRSPSSKR